MLCHAVAVKPPPKPCHAKSTNAITNTKLGESDCENHAKSAIPKNGMRSFAVMSTAKGLYRFKRLTRPAVNNCGSCHPMVCSAGIRPIRIAELVKVLIKRGMTVTNEANPSAAPKKPPSSKLTTKLKGRCLATSCVSGTLKESDAIVISYLIASAANPTATSGDC